MFGRKVGTLTLKELHSNHRRISSNTYFKSVDNPSLSISMYRWWINLFSTIKRLKKKISRKCLLKSADVAWLTVPPRHVKDHFTPGLPQGTLKSQESQGHSSYKQRIVLNPFHTICTSPANADHTHLSSVKSKHKTTMPLQKHYSFTSLEYHFKPWRSPKPSPR